MPNFKKFVALSLGAVCLLSSCNHTVNAEGAKKFIKENFTAEKEASFKGIEKINYSFKISSKKDTDATKTTVKQLAKARAEAANYEKYKDGDTSFNIDLDATSELYKQYSAQFSQQLKEKQIDFYEAVPEAKNTYTISRDEISVWQHANGNFDLGDLKFKGIIDETNIYNNCGFSRYCLFTTDIDMETENVFFKTVEKFTVTFNK